MVIISEITKLWWASLGLAIFVLLCYLLGSIIALFAVSAITAYLLMPIVKFLVVNFKFKHGFAVVCVLLSCFIIVGLIIYFTFPVLYEQLEAVYNNIPDYVQSVSDLIEDIQQYAVEKLNISQDIIDQLQIANGEQYITDFTMNVVNVILTSTLKLFDIVIFIILVLYFMLDGKKMIDSTLKILNEDARKIVGNIVVNTDQMIWKYVKSKFILSLGMAICVYIGIMILNIPYAILLAVAAFVLDFIPFFGSIISSVIIIAVALFTRDWQIALYSGILVLVIQQVEGNIIAPKMQGKETGLHAVWVMFALLASSSIWGPAGMFIAIPAAGFIKIVLIELRTYFNSKSIAQSK